MILARTMVICRAIPRRGQVSVRYRFLFLFPLCRIPVRRPYFQVRSCRTTFNQCVGEPGLTSDPPVATAVKGTLGGGTPLLHRSQECRFVRFLLHLRVSYSAVGSKRAVVHVPCLRHVPQRNSATLRMVRRRIRHGTIPPTQVEGVRRRRVVPLVVSPSKRALCLRLLFLRNVGRVR